MTARYVVETSTVSFGRRVSSVLERGTVERVEDVARVALRHPIVTGWTTPAARILEPGSDANGFPLIPGNSVLTPDGERGDVDSVDRDADTVTLDVCRRRRARRGAPLTLEYVQLTLSAGVVTVGRF